MEEMRPVCWTLGKPCEAHFVDGTTLRGTALELNPDAPSPSETTTATCTPCAPPT